MSNPERGAYTPPTDAPLAFDARQPVRGRGPAPMMLILSAIVLIILVAAIAVFYRTGLHQGSGPPPTVGTPIGEIKGPAPAEAQPVDPAPGLQIYRSAEGQTAPAQPNFTAPPETPRARAPVVAVTPPAAPAPSQAPPKAAPTTAVTAQPAGPVAALPLNGSAPAKPAPAVLKPEISATAPTPKAPAPKVGETAAAPAKVLAAPKPAEAASGAAMVQIGAFSSQALADKGWGDAARGAPGAAAGKGKKVEAIQKDGATLYRTAVTGFATRAEASAFCEKLKAAGKGCFVK